MPLPILVINSNFGCISQLSPFSRYGQFSVQKRMHIFPPLFYSTPNLNVPLALDH